MTNERQGLSRSSGTTVTAPNPQKPSDPQFPGIANLIRADSEGASDTHPNRHSLARQCLSMMGMRHTHLTQPVPPQELPRPGATCQITLCIHAERADSPVIYPKHVPGYHQMRMAITMYQSQSSPVQNQARSNKQLSQSSLRRPWSLHQVCLC